MSVNPYTQLIAFLYEYFNTRSDRAEYEYKQQLDYYYRIMFLAQPQKKIDNNDLLSLIEKKVRHELMLDIQKDVYQILDYYQRFY